MGHRHVFNAPQIFDNESEQEWSHAEQTYMPIARDAPESSSIVHPVDYMANQGGHDPLPRTPAPRSSGYSSSIPNVEFQHYRPITTAPVPSRNPSLYHSAPRSHPFTFQENSSHQPSSSSNIHSQIVNGVDGGFYNPTVCGGRGPYKRKSPGFPPVFEMGSTSRYFDAGSSSNMHLPSEQCQKYHPSYAANSGEGTMRNVRSRTSVDLETNLAMTRSSSNSLHHSSPNLPSNQSDFVDLWGQSSRAPSREWNRNHVPLGSSRGVIFPPDYSFVRHDRNLPNPMIGHPNSSFETGTYNNNVTSSRTQSGCSHLNQSVRGVRSGYGQRITPTFRASSSNSGPGHITASDERHPPVFSNPRFHNVAQNARTCTLSDRYRYVSEASFRDRLPPEGLMVMDHNAFYGSRTMLDQHRDMRLDIDNMGYEELLALGERIGSVNTGLSDGLISKCLTKSVHFSSDMSRDEGTCVICLEEYNNMDDAGKLKNCGHDFHVRCIRKWLSMKNLCPICKAAAVDDSNKDK